MEMPVTKTGLAVFLVPVLMATTALAQAAAPALPLSAADAVKLKMWLDMQTIPAATPTLTFMSTDGEVVPTDVPLYPVPAAAGVPGAQTFSYAKVGDRILLVDPTSRTVVYLIS
jgi:hypothetical protein